MSVAWKSPVDTTAGFEDDACCQFAWQVVARLAQELTVANRRLAKSLIRCGDGVSVNGLRHVPSATVTIERPRASHKREILRRRRSDAESRWVPCAIRRWVWLATITSVVAVLVVAGGVGQKALANDYYVCQIFDLQGQCIDWYPPPSFTTTSPDPPVAGAICDTATDLGCQRWVLPAFYDLANWGWMCDFNSKTGKCLHWTWGNRIKPTGPAPVVLIGLAAETVTTVNPGAGANASAVLANLTMVDGAAPGYITADKCSALLAGPQTRSNGNHDSGEAIANLSVVPLDTDGRFCVYNQVSVNLLADVQGYFAPSTADGQLFVQSAPSRKLDTRIPPLTKPPAGSITKVATGVVPGTSAVLVNLTMVDGATPGYITANKCSVLTAGPQTKSSGNHGVSTAIANLAVVPVDSDGSFCIYNQQPVNLVVDLQGSFTSNASGALGFTLSTPSRRLDTRVAPLTRPGAGAITKVNTGIAPGATAALVNLTMVEGTAAGYITADKCSALVPGPQTKSAGNFTALSAIANLSVVPLDADGSFCIFNSQPVDLVVDVQGAFSQTGAERFFPLAPTRVLDTR